MEQGEIILYQPDEIIKLEVHAEFNLQMQQNSD